MKDRRVTPIAAAHARGSIAVRAACLAERLKTGDTKPPARKESRTCSQVPR